MKSVFRFLVLLLLPMQAWTANIDLQVSSYTYNPGPAINGGLATFTLSVQNNGPAASDISTLSVALPAYCRISSYLQTMASKGINPLIAIQMALAGESQ